MSKSKDFMPESFYSVDNHMSMEQILQAKEHGNFVVGKVLRWNPDKKILIVKLSKYLRGILPFSEISLMNLNDYTDATNLIQKKICVLVKEILDDGTIILSRKENMLKAYDFFSKQTGQIFDCVITHINPKSLTVDLGHGVIGIINGKNLFSYCPDLIKSKRFSVGDTISARIQAVDKQSYSILLMHKKLFKDLSSSFKPGSLIEVIVYEPHKNSRRIYKAYVNENTYGTVKFPSKIGSVKYGSKVVAKVAEKKSKLPNCILLSFIRFTT